MSSKLNSGVRYVYMRGGAAWELLRVKADMVLFAGNTVWSISERVSVQIDVTFTFTSDLAFQKTDWIFSVTTDQ